MIRERHDILVHYHSVSDSGRATILCQPNLVLSDVHRATGVPWLVRCEKCKELMAKLGIKDQGAVVAQK